MINANKPAGRIIGLHSSILASFQFTRQSIHCIDQAGEQTGQNIYYYITIYFLKLAKLVIL